MTWLDELVFTWVHIATPFAAHASACEFGTNWAKTWCFVSNKPGIKDPALTNLLRLAGAGCGDCSIHYSSGHGLEAE
jgi:hypothetical protein